MTKNKKALSEMVSYVILISITIGLSIGVFAWLKAYSNIEPTPNCDDETTIVMLENPKCYLETGTNAPLMDIKLKNNGRFNISGIVFGVSDTNKRAPVYYLIPKAGSGTLTDAGYYFNQQLSPGGNISITFSNKASNKNDLFSKIEVIQIQPFIKVKNSRIVCKNSVIKQNIGNCVFN